MSIELIIIFISLFILGYVIGYLVATQYDEKDKNLALQLGAESPLL
jgi:hypothetical protein